MSVQRIGQGFDVHPFTDKRPLVLCGLELPGELGLDGHSDGDVALHALTDALLGAVAAGDLGEHFPSTEQRWKGADSKVFLSGAHELVVQLGYRLVNCDLTIIGQRPRIAPHRNEMRKRLAEILELSSERISVKATTTDGLGFAGRGEGLGALAVVLITKEEPDE